MSSKALRIVNLKLKTSEKNPTNSIAEQKQMAMSVKDLIRQIEISDEVFDVEIQSLNDEAHSLLVKSSSHWYTVKVSMKAQYTSIHHHVHHFKSPKDRAIPFRVLG